MPHNIMDIERELCAGCGTCLAVCPEKAATLVFDRSRGSIQPRVDETKCIDCGLCVDVCPGIHISFKQLSDEAGLEHHDNLCNASEAWLAYSNDDEHRTKGSSGGVLTETLSWLMDHGLINGAIVTAPLKGTFHGFARPFVARNKEEILLARGSKYCPTAVNSILGGLQLDDKILAYVGLPCHVAGLRALQQKNATLRARIPYVLGLFCSRTPNSLATFWLLAHMGIKPAEILELHYRGDGHPGQLRLVLKDNSERHLPHLDWRYWGFVFGRYFKPARCWLCPDHSAALADASFGDNWIYRKEFLGENRGVSNVVIRSKALQGVFASMMSDKTITAMQASMDEVIASQNLAYKCNVGPRLSMWKAVGCRLPDYDHPPVSKASYTRILGEAVDLVRIKVSSEAHVFLNTMILCDSFFSHLSAAVSKPLRGFAHQLRGLVLFFQAFVPQQKAMAKTAKLKILFTGGYGWKDIGDEAMPYADVLNFRKEFPDRSKLAIVMLSPDPEYTSATHGETAIPDLSGVSREPSDSWKTRAIVQGRIFLLLSGAHFQRMGIRLRLTPSLRLIVDEVSTSNLLFNVGGGNLNSIMPSELYKKCTLYRVARILGKPVIVSGQTVGPFYSASDRRYAKKGLNCANLITLRDSMVSQQRLHDIGVNRPKIMDAADDAITLPGIDRKIAEALLRADVSGQWTELTAPMRIAMNLKGSLGLFKGQGREGQLGREVEVMAQLADRLVEEFSAKVFFVPTDYSPGVDDRPFHRQIRDSMRYRERAACVEQEYRCTELKGIIGLSDVAIGARYHFNVFAAGECIPFLGMASGVYQMTKLKGLADLCGLQDCFENIDLEHGTLEGIWPRVSRVVTSREEIQKKLEHIVPTLRERSLVSVRHGIRVLRPFAQ